MRKFFRNLFIVFVILIVLILALWGGKYIFHRNYVILDGKPCSRQTTSLDLSGQAEVDLDTLAELKNLQHLDLRGTGITLGEHEWLQRQIPQCEIDWEVLFQGTYYQPDVEDLTITSLNMGDVVLLDYLPNLTDIDARECKDYDALAELARNRPECRVLYNVEIGGQLWDQDTEELILSGADSAELSQRLPALLKLKTVQLTEPLPGPEEIQTLAAQLPQVEFTWQVAFGENTYDGSARELALLYLQGTRELIEKLPYFPELERLDLRGGRFLPEERQALEQQYPQVEILWDVVIDGTAIPVDTKTLDLSGHTALSLSELEAAFPYLPDLRKVVLCDCGFSSEELDSLNRKYENIRIVWNVTIGGRNTRTDETYFAPNKWGIKLNDENSYDLRYCTDMVCVDIGHMKNVTNCEWAAFMPELTYLIVAETSIRDLSPLKDLKKLKYLEAFLAPVTDLTPLVGCTALEDLNLCYTYGDPEPIGEMTWLKRVWWTKNWKAQVELPGKLPNTYFEFASPSSTGNGWREGPLYYAMRDYIGMGYMKG